MQKKNYHHVFLLILCFVFSISAAQNWQWAKQGGTLGGNDVANAITVDAFGNYLITGGFNSTIGAVFGSCQLPITKGFVTKFDQNGDCISSFPLWRESKSISADLFGNFFVAGTLYNDSIFISKFNENGTLLWGKKGDAIVVVVTDSSGCVYVTGAFSGVLNIDTISLYTGGTPSGFIAKFDSSGNCFWAKKISTTTPRINAISVDAVGNCYITGQFIGPINFDTIALNSLGTFDIFVAKYDNSGNCSWAQRAGGINEGGGYSQDKGYAIAATANGDLFVTGSFIDTATFGATQLIGRNGNDVFIAKYSTSGNLIWVNKYGTYYDNEGYSITVDDLGNCYVGGRYVNSISFGNTTLQGDFNTYDLFVAKIDGNGNSIWASTAGSTSWNDVAAGIALSGNDVLITGVFTGTNPAHFGTDTLVSNGNDDIFISKLGNFSGINENSTAAQTFTLFPNPATSELFIKTNGEEINQINIYNMLGERVMAVQSSIFNLQFSIAALPSGVYIAELRTKDTSVKKMWVKE